LFFAEEGEAKTNFNLHLLTFIKNVENATKYAQCTLNDERVVILLDDKPAAAGCPLQKKHEDKEGEKQNEQQ
jgi:hypothetical protein